MRYTAAALPNRPRSSDDRRTSANPSRRSARTPTDASRTATGPIRNGINTAIPTPYVIASTMKAPSTPNREIATAATNGPNASDDWNAVASNAFACASWSSSTRRGGKAWNAGSANALTAPTSAASSTTVRYEFAKRNVNETTPAAASATSKTRFGPNRSIGTPANDESNIGGRAHDTPSNANSPAPAWNWKLA